VRDDNKHQIRFHSEDCSGTAGGVLVWLVPDIF
jgi:hypothetical protein